MTQKYLYGLSLMGLGPATLKILENNFEDWQEAWQSSSLELNKAGLKKSIIQKIISDRQKINIEKEWLKLQNTEINFITIKDASYPQQLREIKSAPFILFYYGNIELLTKKQLAVVGTRRPTEYGKMLVEKLVPEIVQSEMIITSGMAQGIDSLAHRTSLESGGSTIAVLGAGIIETQKNGYQKKIFDEIIEQNGLIISEYPPFYPASKYTFPARNRIVSGLSLGVLVIEAGIKSGTLITANYALEHNREVFAVPGNIFSEKSIGTHQLLKEGAQLVSSGKDILEAFSFSLGQAQLPLTEKKEIIFSDEEEKLIYNKLSLDPSTIDSLIKRCHLTPAIIAHKLSLLELKGLAKNIGGGRFIKI